MTETPERTGATPEAPLSPGSAPIAQNRFLFVDVAALRAKQLRRGALPRLPGGVEATAAGHRAEHPTKLERIAMEEVRLGIISYQLPDGGRTGHASAPGPQVEEGA